MYRVLAAQETLERRGQTRELIAGLGDDALLAVFDEQRVMAYPPGRLLYHPVLPEVPDPPAAAFAASTSMYASATRFCCSSP